MDLEVPGSPEQDEEEEAAPVMAKETQPGSPKGQSPSSIVRVLGTLSRRRRWLNSSLVTTRGGSNNVPADIVEENKDEDEPKNMQVE